MKLASILPPAVLLLLLLPLAAVRPVRAGEPASLLEQHLADARRAVRPQAPAADTGTQPFEARLREIRDQWAERLRAPAALATFEDFDTPRMRERLAQAKGPGYAASLAQGVTLDAVLAGAFVRNPGLHAAKRRLAATVERYAQVTALDDVLRQYASFLRAVDTRVGSALPHDTVAADFPFPGRLELESAIVRHAIEGARARYEIALRDLVTEVRVTFADYVYAGQAVSNTREMLQYLRQLEETARSKLAAGTAQKTHVLQVQVQVSQLENDLLTLGLERDTVRAHLVSLVALPASSPLGTPETPPLPPAPADADALSPRALAEQPEILAAEARAAGKTTMIELAERSTYPPLSPGSSRMERPSHATGGSAKAREPFHPSPRVRPDPFFGSKEAYLREAREAARAARLDVQAARDRTAWRVTAALNQLAADRRLVELYRDVQLAQARQAWDDASAAYAADRVEFMSVIDALRQWLRFRLDADRAARDVRRAHARLASAVGGSVARAP